MLAALTLAKLAAFGKTNWRIIAAVFLISTAYLYARHQGAESVKRKDAALYAKAAAKAQVVTTDLASSARKAGDDASASRERIVYRTRTIIQRVPNEIPRSGDVWLSGGFLRLYNASLGLPEDPRRAGQPAVASGGLYSADALVQAIVPNNSSCAWYADNYPRLLSLYDQAAAKVNSFNPR